MKLTELIVCIAFFLVFSCVFFQSFLAVNGNVRSVKNICMQGAEAVSFDAFLRNEVRKMKIPYWKNFENCAFSYSEKIWLCASEKNAEIKGVVPVIDKKKGCEGFLIEWSLNGRTYVTREVIKQRIVDEE